MCCLFNDVCCLQAKRATLESARKSTRQPSAKSRPAKQQKQRLREQAAQRLGPAEGAKNDNAFLQYY
jgi:hypothetical protein